MKPLETAGATRLLPRWALPAAAACWVLQCVAFHDLRRDDAFITFHYAQNLANGHGLVFNVGERLMGSTSPGHVLLAALVYPLFGQTLLPSVMSCLGCLGWTAQALAWLVLLRRALPPNLAAAISLAVAIGAPLSAENVSLETNIVAALLMWALATAIEQRWSWAAALAALAGLFRPDMFLPALVLAGLCIWDLRARARKPALLFLAITAPWFLFAQGYFGSVLPQSASAKYQRTHLIEYAVFEFRTAAGLALPLIADGGPLACAGAWALALVGGFYLARQHPRLWLVPAFALAHFAAYLYLRPFMHWWHLYPANAVFVVLVLVAIASCLGLIARVGSARHAGAAIVALLLVLYAQRTVDFARTHADAFWFGGRDRVYRQLSAYLTRHARPSDVVASVEVGTIGYYTGLTMYDWGGLITKHPEYRPRKPRLAWTAVDALFADHLSQGTVPVLRLRSGGFDVSVHSFELFGAAVARVLARAPGQSIEQIALRDPGALEREVQQLAAQLAASNLRVDEFLRRTAR